MIVVKSISTIRDEIISDYETESGSTTPLLPVGFIRIWATVMAGMLHLVYRFLAWVLRQISARTADPDQLREIGSQYRITQIAPVAAVIEALATGLAGVVIPAETTWQINGTVYAVITQVEVDGSGEAIISLRCLEPGAIGNQEVGAELSIVGPIPNLDNTASVNEVLIRGEDEEDIELYRERVILRQRTPPQGGAIPDWVAWTLEVAGVIDALAWRTAPGEVTVYPIVGLTYEDRLPDESKRSEIQAYISDPVRVPLNCENVEVGLFDEVVFNVTISNLVPNNSEVRAAIASSLDEYMLSRRPRQYPVVRVAKDFISKLNIGTLIEQAGGASATITLDVLYGDSDIDVYQLGQIELARLGDLTFA